MPKLQTILAATDFSEGAGLAVGRAARLAQAHGAALWLLHVLDDGAWASVRKLYDLEHWTGADPVLAARERLARQAADLSDRFGVSVKAETRSGRAPAAIAGFARECAAGLLVMGVQAEDWLRYTMLGGSALRVLEHADVPVLLVRRSAATDFSRVLVATDFSAGAGRAARMALALCPAARPILLNAYAVGFEGRMRLGGATNEDIERYREQESRRAADRMQAFLAELGEDAGRFEPRHVHGYPAASILKQAEEAGAELIAVGKHGGSALEERLIGSVAQNILYNANCDVLLSP
jgi:nucleotide-binding universal stress UspA family protein